MSGKGSSSRGEHRSSALWGTGNRGGESRSSALWGKGGRGLVTALCAVLVVAAPLAAGGNKQRNQRTQFKLEQAKLPPTYIAPSLLETARTTPNKLVKVLIQSQSTSGMTTATKAYDQAAESDGSDRETIRDKFGFVGTIAVSLEAWKIPYIDDYMRGLIVVPDAKVKLSAEPTSRHLWPTASGVKPLWGSMPAAGERMPTIAIVDSGIDKNRADFSNGARVLQEVTITKLEPNSSGDGRGHGTFVAGIAAGSAPGQAGAAPNANIVSLDVMDDSGMALTSDVIAAAEWIYEHRMQYNIRVANFSLHSVMPSNFHRDPLDRAVEKLWFNGVVVVAAAGNYGIATGPSGVKFAPGNDPFVITVGALDLDGTTRISEHEVPNWSAYGYTYDGFRKPEVAAAGRYMIGPVPAAATLKVDKPANVLPNNYMRLSGTSFAAPIVAGAAAQLLVKHPEWTPDQVKGALMLRARYVPEATHGEAGVGEINAARSALVTNPPNPNGSLNRFLRADPLGAGTMFDAASWSDAAKSSVSWDSASWSDASWSDSAVQSVSWSDVSWTDASWSDVSWSDVVALADVSWEDAAGGEGDDPPVGGDYELTPEEEAAAAADPLLTPPALLEAVTVPALP
jgi:serine protease AprX